MSECVAFTKGQNIESELYRTFLSQGCDLLIATPTIVCDLIQKRHIHFERLEMLVVSRDHLYKFSYSSLFLVRSSRSASSNAQTNGRNPSTSSITFE